MMLRISALAIAVIAAIGLWKKAWLPEKKCFRAGFFVYYTHLSNLFILVYELVLGASGHDPDGGKDPDHVGAVLCVEGDFLYTIEGNSGGKVAVQRYPKNDPRIVGYGVLNWKTK